MFTKVAASLLFALCLALPLPAFAQFEPEFETGFDNLKAGEATLLTQDMVFFADEEGPDSYTTLIDRGSLALDDAVVDDAYGIVLVTLYIVDPETGDVLVDGDIECDLIVTVVDTDAGQVTMGAVVSEVAESVLTFLEEFGIDDPTDEQIYTLLMEETDDDGVSLDLSDDGVVSAPEMPTYDIEISVEIDPLYTHSPYSGITTVTTELYSQLGSDFSVEEEFELEGGKKAPPPPPLFKRGDANGDNTVSGLGDGLFLLRFQFENGADGPTCMAAADANRNGEVSGLGDGLFLLFWQFVDGADVPPDPGVKECGEDPDYLEPDALGCDTPPDCE